jgi:hypothetical protein
MKELISEYEELLKIKTFAFDKARDPEYYTYQKIKESLGKEYVANIDEKLTRWINITKYQFLEYNNPVLFYIQTKMLYRDGFYEASIVLCRSICEMICYDLIEETPNPYQTREDIEYLEYRHLLRYLYIPKIISKSIFENQIKKHLDNDKKNLIGVCYDLDSDKKNYRFKIECGKKKTTLIKLNDIFEETNFSESDKITKQDFTYLGQLYDKGNLYVHAHSHNGKSKTDAEYMVNGVGKILFSLYGTSSLPIKKTIKSAYSEFPEICTGINLAIECYNNPINAKFGHLNLPTPTQISEFKKLCGDWKGNWGNSFKDRVDDIISLYLIKDELFAKMKMNSHEVYGEQDFGIWLFQSYFELKGVEYSDKELKPLKKDELKFDYFKLYFHNTATLIGEILHNGIREKIVFNKITVANNGS